MDYQDYYQTLGVPRTASQAEIKKAFRKLARENHPDAKPDDATSEQRFKQINEANAVLSDPEKRKKYDMLGANWEQMSRAGAGAGAAGQAGNPFAGFAGGGGGGNVRYEFRTSSAGGGDFSDFFRMFFGGDAATDPSGPGRGRRPTGGQTFDDILRDMGIDGAAVGRGEPPRPSPGRVGGPGRRHRARRRRPPRPSPRSRSRRRSTARPAGSRSRASASRCRSRAAPTAAPASSSPARARPAATSSSSFASGPTRSSTAAAPTSSASCRSRSARRCSARKCP